MGKQRRAHLHQRIERTKESYIHETERGGNPQTLVVTKTRAGWQAKVKDWKKRRAEAMGVFKSYGQDTLRKLLGDQYAEIVSGSLGAVAEAVPNEQAAKRQKAGDVSGYAVCHLATPSGNTIPFDERSNQMAGAGTKRKAEGTIIID